MSRSMPTLKDQLHAQDEIRRVTEEDSDKPSLVPFFLMEFLKYSAFVVVCYIIYTFAEPYYEEIKAYLLWLTDSGK